MNDTLAEKGLKPPTASRHVLTLNNRGRHQRPSTEEELTVATPPRVVIRTAKPDSSTQTPKPRKPKAAKPLLKAGKSSKRASKRRKGKPASPMFDLSVYHNGMSGQKVKQTPAHIADDADSISLAPTSSPNWGDGNDIKSYRLLKFAQAGQAVQCWQQGEAEPERERDLVLGLDFGTSTVKAVFGDSVIGRNGHSFAVPFRDTQGLPRFLLPCRLYQSGDVLSLEHGDKVLSDLKLGLLNNPASAERQQHVVAFLALVIRQARAWLFTHHTSIYKGSKIVWKLALGLPSENHLVSQESQLFERLGLAAWVLAGNPVNTITRQAVIEALDRARQLLDDDVRESHEDVEMSVIPEIAAQIYGYVASEHFDPAAANDFMMVDIGAGTVDVSLFHVMQGRGGRWEFVFYTTVVKPMGTINLHRRRLDWWALAIETEYPERDDLWVALEEGKAVSDIQAGLPVRLEDYFTKAGVHFSNPDDHLDNIFFKEVFSQVFHEGYWKASNGHLNHNELNDIPAYLCGGGSRHAFYEQLTNANEHCSFYSWMKVDFRTLNKPDNLDAPGLIQHEFDRLSVAYGLSFLDVGRVLKAIPRPPQRPAVKDAYWDNFIDK